MCINKEVSWGAFAVGTIFNFMLVITAARRKWTELAVLAIAFQFVVIIQFFEALVWSGDTWLGTQGLVTILLLQPILIGLVMLMLPNPIFNRVIVVAVLIIYAIYIVATLNTLEPYIQVPIPEQCGHIVYSFWDQFPMDGLPYLFALTAALVFLVSPQIGLTIFTVGVITLATAGIVYPCSFGSMWCLFAVMVPAILLILTETEVIAPEAVTE